MPRLEACFLNLIYVKRLNPSHRDMYRVALNPDTAE